MGVMVVHQWGNVLFDLILANLFRLFGAEAAQRLSISMVVLTFVFRGTAPYWLTSLK